MTTILGVAGSLRKESFNKKLLAAAIELCPAGARIEVLDWSAVPVFNQDDELDLPAPVVAAKTAIRAADAVLFVTPEYNYSIPGPLKNLIDWCTRPVGDSAWRHKPVAVIGASIGAAGTVRSQLHLRQCFVALDMLPVQMPQVLVSRAATQFDASGKLTDGAQRKAIGDVLAALVRLTHQLGT